MDMGKYLKEKRESLGLSQTDVANAVGVSRSAVCKWESGAINDIRRDRVSSLARTLRVNPMDIISGVDSETIPADILSPINKRRLIRIDVGVPCGKPTDPGDPAHETVYIHFDGDADYVLTAKGDSMSPKINDGDTVFIRQQEDVHDGQIAVVSIDGECTLKTVHHIPGGLNLVPINTEYSPIIVTENPNVRILGLAVAFTRSLI